MQYYILFMNTMENNNVIILQKSDKKNLLVKYYKYICRTNKNID